MGFILWDICRFLFLLCTLNLTFFFLDDTDVNNFWLLVFRIFIPKLFKIFLIQFLRTLRIRDLELHLFGKVAIPANGYFYILVGLDGTNARLRINCIHIVRLDLFYLMFTLNRNGDYFLFVMVKDWSFSSGEKSRLGTETRII